MRTEKPDFNVMAEEMLTGIDSDEDGSVTVDEFASALLETSDLDSDGAAELAAQIDSDEDSVISTEELMSALEAMGPPAQAGAMPPPPPGPPPSETSETDEEEISEIFSSLDTDEDGVISQEEFSALFADNTETTATTAETTSDGTTEEEVSMYDQMLQQLVAYYGSDSYGNETASLLNLDA